MSSPSDITKGSKLEFQAAAYFQNLGYLVRRGVGLVTSSGTSDVTDIDILAIRFAAPLSEERVVIDCKNKKKPHPYERILWVKGLSFFANANRQAVILPNVPWQAREFGEQGSVEILNSKDLPSDDTDSGENGTIAFSDADQKLELITNIRKKYAKQYDQDAARGLAREEIELNRMLVEGHPITNLNRIIVMLSEVGGSIDKDTGQESDYLRWLKLKTCCNGAVIAGVMLLRFACENKWTMESDWTAYAQKKMTYGDISPQQAQRLAGKLVGEAQIGDSLSPTYTEELISVIKMLIEDQDMAAKVPYALDYYLFGSLSLTYSNKSERIVPRQVEEKTMRAVRQIISALSYAAEISSKIWSRENFSKRTSSSLQRTLLDNE